MDWHWKKYLFQTIPSFLTTKDMAVTGVEPASPHMAGFELAIARFGIWYDPYRLILWNSAIELHGRILNPSLKHPWAPRSDTGRWLQQSLQLLLCIKPCCNVVLVKTTFEMVQRKKNNHFFASGALYNLLCRLHIVDPSIRKCYQIVSIESMVSLQLFSLPFLYIPMCICFKSCNHFWPKNTITYVYIEVEIEATHSKTIIGWPGHIHITQRHVSIYENYYPPTDSLVAGSI